MTLGHKQWLCQVQEMAASELARHAMHVLSPALIDRTSHVLCYGIYSWIHHWNGITYQFLLSCRRCRCAEHLVRPDTASMSGELVPTKPLFKSAYIDLENNREYILSKLYWIC